MKPDNTRDRSNSSNRAAKAMSAIPAIGIVVAASLLLLSGLSTIGSYHSVLAQQAMPQGGGINANITAGEGNATTTICGRGYRIYTTTMTNRHTISVSSPYPLP